MMKKLLILVFMFPLLAFCQLKNNAFTITDTSMIMKLKLYFGADYNNVITWKVDSLMFYDAATGDTLSLYQLYHSGDVSWVGIIDTLRTKCLGTANIDSIAPCNSDTLYIDNNLIVINKMQTDTIEASNELYVRDTAITDLIQFKINKTCHEVISVDTLRACNGDTLIVDNNLNVIGTIATDTLNVDSSITIGYRDPGKTIGARSLYIGEHGMSWDGYASGDNSFAIQGGAAGEKSFAMYEGEATGEGSFSIGGYPSNVLSFSHGANTYTRGNTGFASGWEAISQSFSEVVFGQYNDTSDTYDTETWDVDDNLFVVGYGTSDGDRKNAITIKKSGIASFDTTLRAPNIRNYIEIPAIAMTLGNNSPTYTSDIIGLFKKESLAFDFAANDTAQISLYAPFDMDSVWFRTIEYRQTSGTAASDTVVWEMSGVSRANGEAINVAIGTATSLISKGYKSDTTYISDISNGVLISANEGEEMTFFLVRKVAAPDNLAVASNLLELIVYFIKPE